jgi:hypothetical protein
MSIALSELKQVAALLTVAALEERMRRGDGDGVDKPGAQPLAGSTGGMVVRVAGDPQPRQSVSAREREKQPRGPLSVVVTLCRRIDVVTNVAIVQLGVARVPDAQADRSRDLDRRIELGAEAHPEVVVGDTVAKDLTGLVPSRGKAEELLDLCTGVERVLRRPPARERMMAGVEQGIEPRRIGRDQLEFAIDHRAGVEELKGHSSEMYTNPRRFGEMLKPPLYPREQVPMEGFAREVR